MIPESTKAETAKRHHAWLGAAAGGAAGGVGSSLFAPAIVEMFGGAPQWVLPALVAVVVALGVITGMLVPLQKRRRSGR